MHPMGTLYTLRRLNRVLLYLIYNQPHLYPPINDCQELSLSSKDTGLVYFRPSYIYFARMDRC